MMKFRELHQMEVEHFLRQTFVANQENPKGYAD
jgi:hypothetical protein